MIEEEARAGVEARDGGHVCVEVAAHYDRVSGGVDCFRRLARGKVEPRTFSLRSMTKRVAKVGDLWADLAERGYSLHEPLAKLQQLA